MKTNLNSRQSHLSDEQFTDLLLGTNPPSVREHLMLCAECSQEAERVAGAISSFSMQTRLWAERRAASHSVHVRETHRTLTWLHRPYGWTAAVVAVIFAMGIGVSLRFDHARPAAAPIAQVQPAAPVDPTTIKSDNALLSAIDGELREDDAGNVGMYGLNPVSHSKAKASKRMSN